jgi:predicted nucleic acid-binding protein
VPRYLADTSIWAWAAKPQRPDIKTKLAQRIAADEVVTCVPVALEVMHRPDTSAKYAQQFENLLSPLDWLALTEAAGWRAMEVQQLLAAQSDGGHRRPAIDFLIAAIAESHEDIVLWAFDNDYAVISSLTGQLAEIEVSTGRGR